MCMSTSAHCMDIAKPCVCSQNRRLCMNSRADQDHWREQISRLPAEPIDESLRIAVLAAHPDDEAMGASAVLARAKNPLVIFLTDGAPRDQKLWSPDFHGEREEYAD